MNINTKSNVITTIVNPVGSMRVLSNEEVKKLQDTSQHGLHKLFRQCALAVLNGEKEKENDNAEKLMKQYNDFDIKIIQEHRGLKLELINAPSESFIQLHLIRGIKENLFSVLRDILYVSANMPNIDQKNHASGTITHRVFELLRNADLFKTKEPPNTIVCWGGHSIARHEYEYTKKVGYQLGLRYMNVCTGCGPGAMKGPMKGAYIGHAKQRINNGRFIGLTEPSIIAAESPNPIVNELIILPDIEKRLEAFIRLGHGFIVFPGGPGTCEEILYLLGILLHPNNEHIPFPLVFTGPKSSKNYFSKINHFIGSTLGKKAQSLYKIIIDDPQKVAISMRNGLEQVTRFRRKNSDAYYFNWLITIDQQFQIPFKPTHASMSQLKLNLDVGEHELAVNLRQLMSGIVTGNIKEEGIMMIREHGPFQITGHPTLMKNMDTLLQSFVDDQRMKLPGSNYYPCYEIKY